MERMGDQKLAMKADVHKVEGKGGQGRLRKQWEDCIKRGLERLGGGENGEQQQD